MIASISQSISLNYDHLLRDEDDSEQELLDLNIDDLKEPPKPEPAAAPAPAPATEAPPVPANKLNQLEDRYENLVRILLDRGILLPKDLDELM